MAWRRRGAIAALGSLALAGAAWHVVQQRYLNACASAVDPGHAVNADLLSELWQGLEPAKVWDCHLHLAGVADRPEQGEPWTNPALRRPTNPFLFAHFALYADASCVLDQPLPANQAYVQRLMQLIEQMPEGMKFMLYAMDGCLRADGSLDAQRSVMHVPNAYARRIALQRPARFEWVASINPYRPDALAQLRQAASEGAVALKWVPYFMDIDPGAPALNPFYDLLAELRLPLIVHAGWQHELLPGGQQEHGNPLRLRRALERGVKVVVAHCATQGDFADIDVGPGGPQRSAFELFSRLIDEPTFSSLLMGDVSGITDSGRDPRIVRALLTESRWQGRLLNGSDYPLPGIAVAVSSSHLVASGLLAPQWPALVDHMQAHNPLLFDFALKRKLVWQGRHFPAQVFETAAWFPRPGGLN
jgi:uncharacterized protein